MYKPRPGEKGYGPRFWPNHLISEAAMAIWAIGIIVFLAGYFTQGLQAPADPFHTPEHIKPEWYFLPLYEILRLTPQSALGIADFNKPFTLFLSGVAMLALMLVPWIDRTAPEAQHPRKRPLIAAVFLLCAAGVVVLMILGGRA